MCGTNHCSNNVHRIGERNEPERSPQLPPTLLFPHLFFCCKRPAAWQVESLLRMFQREIMYFFRSTKWESDRGLTFDHLLFFCFLPAFSFFSVIRQPSLVHRTSIVPGSIWTIKCPGPKSRMNLRGIRDKITFLGQKMRVSQAHQFLRTHPHWHTENGTR